MIKKLIKIGVATFILFCMAVGIGSVYVYLHQDDLKQIALDKMNESVDATILFTNSNANFFKTFPNVGMTFENPVLFTDNDTLLSCEELLLTLNLIDFIKKDYRIKNLSLRNGTVDLKTLEDGNPNYEIWRSSNNQGEDLNFEIEDISIQNVKLDFEDLPTNNSYDFLIDNLSADLHLTSDIWLINLDGLLNEFIYCENSKAQVDEKKIKIAAELIYDDIAEELTFSGFDITNENVFATGNGKIGLVENEKNIDISFNAKGNPKGILSVFKHYYQLPENYTCKGDIDINSSLYYEMGKPHSLTMSNDLVISKALVKESKSRERIENINYSGTLEINENRYDLITKSLACEMRQGILNANGTITDLRNPNANLQFQGNFDLDELATFLGLEGINIEGDLQFNNRLTGNFKKGDFDANTWVDHTEIIGEARLKDASIEWPDHDVMIKSINGNLDFNEENIAVKDLNAKVQKTNITLNGVISNVLKYATSDNESIEIEAYLEVDEISIEDFIASRENSIHQSELTFPKNIKFKLNSDIENLIFNSFRAESINGVLTYEDKMFKANQIVFNSCDGQVIGDISIKERNGEFDVECNTSMRDLNITQIFESFAEFDQDFITSKHISGVTTSTCKFSGVMDPYLDFDKKSIETTADIQISNGELVNHPPLQEIAVYLRKKSLLNPFLKVDELEENLKHLSFNTLENRIEIKDEMILIPKMEIQSSAMDANITGLHSFDHKIDYRIDFRMREMLKEREVEIEEIVVEDDGTGSRIFLVMTGTAQTPEIAFDKESARAKRKSDLKNAKEDFLDIFRKKQDKESTKEGDIKIDVEESSNDSVIASNKKKKGLKKLLEILAKDEKDSEEVDFEIVDDEE